MSEFDKWLDKDCPTVRPTSSDAAWAKIVWLAALKWVKSIKQPEYDVDMRIDKIQQEIKELENE